MKLTCLKYAETFLHERSIFRTGAKDAFRLIDLLFYLIETDGRRILVDAGCDWLNGFVMQSFRHPTDVLREVGVEPEDVTDLIITHAHLDHAGGAKYFPNATVWIQQDELPAARHFLAPNAAVRTFRETAEIADRVNAVCVGGHSIGSSIVRINSERPIILGGDECYHSDCLRLKIPTGASFCPEKSEAFVREYADERYTVLLFHDPAVMSGGIGFKTVTDRA